MKFYSTLPIFAVTTMGLNMRDKAERQKVCQQFNIPEPHTCQNVHKDGIVVVRSPSDPIQEGDAMITQVSGLPLIIYHADCQVGIFYDPISKTLAVAHSGWRGSNLNIFGKVVDQMEHLGCQRSQILAAISPSLGPEKSEFIHYKKELDPSLWKYEHRPLYFDFWKIAEDQLLGARLVPKNIYLSRVCTHSSPEFHSYRRDKTAKRDGTIAMMRPGSLS